MSAAGRPTWRFLAAVFGRYRRLVAVAILGALAAALLEGGTMALFALALHSLTGGSQSHQEAGFGFLGGIADQWGGRLAGEHLFLLLVGAAIVFQMLRAALGYASDLAAINVLARAEGDTRRRLFRSFMYLEFDRARRRKVGDLASYVEQVNFLGLSLQRLKIIIQQGLLLVVYLIVLMWLSWQGTLLAAAAMLLTSLSLRPIVARVHRTGGQFKGALVKVSEGTVELLSGLRLLRIFAREEYAIDRMETVIDRSVDARRRGLSWQASISPLIESLAALAVGLFLILGFLTLRGADSGALARYATFLFVLFRLAPRLGVINKNWGLLNNYLPFAERIALFLAENEPRAAGEAGKPFGGLVREIRFEGVSHRYAGREQAALSDVSFTLAKGTMVGIVGESGAGKSTLADLLLRLIDPTEGRILVDGEDLRSLDWQSWRARIGMVSQETFLLNSSIRENIALGRPRITEEEIRAAARQADADGFISSLDQGYETVIGDRGYRLSGGQRQRLAIARAIVGDPDVLILDEATSDLDSRSEQAIHEALTEFGRERTVLAIAHRLSTLARADSILVLAEGRVVESGTHSELLRQSGRYAKLWQLQAAQGRATPEERLPAEVPR